MRAGTLAVPSAFRFRDLATLTKSGITGMVVVSSAAGILLAADGIVSWRLWLNTLVGIALVAAGASALNQVVERELDGKMHRTLNRPLPAGRLHPDLALAAAVVLSVLGVLLLAFAVHLTAALLAAATLAGYVFVYTPLKRVSSLATVVGAVPGAMPPVIGWVAVRGELGAGAWALFALLFFWQMPHFLSIAWLFREDYARGGFRMITLDDPDGLRTSRMALLYCAALVPVSLLPTALGLAGHFYFVSALLGGAWFFFAAARFTLQRTTPRARRLMLVSVFYLPLVLGALMIDRLLA
jgi:heme o synthase